MPSSYKPRTPCGADTTHRSLPFNAEDSRIERARELRQSAEMPERILWSRLRGGRLGFKFRRQQPVGPYVADFYCHEARLVVEVDGYRVHRNRRGQDDARDRYLAAEGMLVLRFGASSVTRNADDVTARIRAVALSRSQAVPKPESGRDDEKR